MATAEQTGRIACPHCGAMIKSAGLSAGAAVNCPKCERPFRIGQEAVQGPKSKVQSQVAVDGRGSKDEGRKVAVTVPVPPPPPGVVQSPKSKVQGREGEASAELSGVNPKSNPGAPAQPPKPHPRDVLVDPNLLPPPPPKAKEKVKEVAVVCRLCATRTYAPLEKIGQEVKCPDCHTRNEVPGLKEEPIAKAKGPSLEGTEEFGMSDVVERPKYRPLVRGREEYDVLSAADPAAMEHRLTTPGQRPRAKEATAEAADQGEDGEITLEPVEERAESARDPRSILPQPEMEPDNPLYDGRYDDTVFGDRVDPKSPDAWKRAPFLYGIVEFVARPSTLVRAVPLAMLLMMAAAAGAYTFRQAFGDLGNAPKVVVMLSNGTEVARSGGGNPGKALIGVVFFAPLFSLWIIQLAAVFSAITKDTGNGEDEVTSWPDWNVMAWFMPALYFAAAGLISIVPGGLIAGWTLWASSEDPLMAAFGMGAPVLISLMVLFPFIYFSMLVDDSVMAIASPHTLRSLKIASEGWMFFYMYSLVLVLLAALGVAMAVAGQFVVAVLGAAGTTAVALLYARLLGRLMWVASQREAAGERRQGAGVRSQ